jgi:hypothetical protein
MKQFYNIVFCFLLIPVLFSVSCSQMLNNNNSLSGTFNTEAGTIKWTFELAKNRLEFNSESGAAENLILTADQTKQFSAFIYANTINITVLSGISTLGDYVFEGFKNVHKASIASTVITVGKGIFKNCPVDDLDLSSNDLSNWDSAWNEGIISN